jgi:hypothetical protein
VTCSCWPARSGTCWCRPRRSRRSRAQVSVGNKTAAVCGRGGRSTTGRRVYDGSGALSQRSEYQLLGVRVEDEFKTANVTAVDDIRTWRCVVIRGTDRQTTRRTGPRHRR